MVNDRNPESDPSADLVTLALNALPDASMMAFDTAAMRRHARSGPDGHSFRLVGAIIALADRRRLTVTAEGVEREALLRTGCHRP